MSIWFCYTTSLFNSDLNTANIPSTSVLLAFGYANCKANDTRLTIYLIFLVRKAMLNTYVLIMGATSVTWFLDATLAAWLTCFIYLSIYACVAFSLYIALIPAKVATFWPAPNRAPPTNIPPAILFKKEPVASVYVKTWVTVAVIIEIIYKIIIIDPSKLYIFIVNMLDFLDSSHPMKDPYEESIFFWYHSAFYIIPSHLEFNSLIIYCEFSNNILQVNSYS